MGELGNDEADTVGPTYATIFGKGIESFVTYRQLGADIADAEDVNLLALGARVKF